MLREHRSGHYAEDRSLEHQLAGTRQAFEDFVYIVAHDLNAPLRCILNFSQLLEQKYATVLDEKARHYVDLITGNSRKAQARLAGLLQYSRLDTVPLKPERVDCNQLLHHCLRQLRLEIGEREAQVRIGRLPLIVADGERLSLLFYCLLSNAIKFCRQRPEIDVTARRGRDAWAFSVRDNGIGIDEAHHHAIFDVFHRLHRDEDYPGIGIGLALAARIAALHGGGIRVESRPDAGATFTFTIADAAAAS